MNGSISFRGVPWGHWEIIGGGLTEGYRIWHHNPHLAITADEQYRQNVENGYMTKSIEIIPPTIELRYD